MITRTIILEGPDATGKSSVARKLKAHYEEQGLTVAHYCEPNDDPKFRGKIRDLAIHNECSDLTRALLMFANRADMFEEIHQRIINEKIDILIMERSLLSTLVYQGHPEYKYLFDELARLTVAYPANTNLYLLTADAATARARRPSSVYDVIEQNVFETDAHYEALTDKYRKVHSPVISMHFKRELHTECLTVDEIVYQITQDMQEYIDETDATNQPTN